MVKRFQSATRAPERPQAERLAPLLFELPGNDRVLVATPPKRAVWQRAMLAGRPNVPLERRSAAIVDFIRGCLADVNDTQHLEDRLLGAADTLDDSDLYGPATWLSNRWSEQTKDPQVREVDWAEYHAFLNGGRTEAEDIGVDEVDGEVPVADLLEQTDTEP